ncbi:MAG: diguanylate cyclase [Syntrophorhabdaceae bacterium]|nr:diguanylate cyclase [Syntrophorhabdaceae bacterium]
MDIIYKEALSNWIEVFLSRGVFVTDENLKVILWNRWLEERSGIPSEKVLGKRVLDVFPAIREKKADRYYYQALHGEAILLAQRLHKFLLPMPPKKDYSCYFTNMQQTVQIAPLVSGWDVVGTVTMIEDVTERIVGEILLKKEAEAARRAEQMVKKERDLAQHYLDIAGVMLLVLDRNGNISLINRKGCEILGYNNEELIGKNWFEVCLPEEDGEKIKGVFISIMEGRIEGYRQFENRVKTRSGEMRIISWNNTLLRDESGQITGTLSSGEDITEKKRLEEALKAMSITDELTGLYNRRGFITLSERQLKIAERARNKMLLFFIDLDGMKWINDTLGHKAGDEALIATAQILRETFRESDIVARVGGDEFVVLAVDTRMTSADKLYRRIKEKVKKYNSERNGPYNLSLSVGYSHFGPDKPKRLDELMEEADRMMYEEKKGKKGEESLFSPGHAEHNPYRSQQDV